MSSRQSTDAGTRVLAEEALKDGACRAVGHKVAFFNAEEAAWWATIWLTVGRTGIIHLVAVIVVDVACGSGRRRLCGSSGRHSMGWKSGHGRCGWGSGFVGSDLLICLPQILFQDPDLVLHGVDQSFHFGVCLLLRDFSIRRAAATTPHRLMA